MALSTIIPAVKTLLEGVAGIGTVHAYLRSAKTQKKFFDTFKTATNKINTWMITRVSTTEQLSSTSYSIRKHGITIVGYYGIEDLANSENVFQTIVENICTKIRENHTLSGTVTTTNNIDVEEVTHEKLGNVMCHMCKLSVVAEEHVIFTSV